MESRQTGSVEWQPPAAAVPDPNPVRSSTSTTLPSRISRRADQRLDVARLDQDLPAVVGLRAGPGDDEPPGLGGRVLERHLDRVGVDGLDAEHRPALGAVDATLDRRGRRRGIGNGGGGSRDGGRVAAPARSA